MMFPSNIYRGRNQAYQGRQATTVLEVMVSLSMLMAALTVSLPLVLHHGRLLIEQRNYRLALDEVSNHLDRLSATGRDELPLALEQLAVSPFTAEKLHDATLTSELRPADVGQRLVVTLNWKSLGEQRVTLAAWLFDDSTPLSATGNEP
jgi:hypothetical protein